MCEIPSVSSYLNLFLIVLPKNDLVNISVSVCVCYRYNLISSLYRAKVSLHKNDLVLEEDEGGKFTSYDFLSITMFVFYNGKGYYLSERN